MNIAPSGALADLSALASRLSAHARSSERRELRRALERAYREWLRLQPGRREDGGMGFRRDGMVLRAVPRSEEKP